MAKFRKCQTLLLSLISKMRCSRIRRDKKAFFAPKWRVSLRCSRPHPTKSLENNGQKQKKILLQKISNKPLFDFRLARTFTINLQVGTRLSSKRRRIIYLEDARSVCISHLTGGHFLRTLSSQIDEFSSCDNPQSICWVTRNLQTSPKIGPVRDGIEKKDVAKNAISPD